MNITKVSNYPAFKSDNIKNYTGIEKDTSQFSNNLDNLTNKIDNKKQNEKMKTIKSWAWNSALWIGSTIGMVTAFKGLIDNEGKKVAQYMGALTWFMIPVVICAAAGGLLGAAYYDLKKQK